MRRWCAHPSRGGCLSCSASSPHILLNSGLSRRSLDDSPSLALGKVVFLSHCSPVYELVLPHVSPQGLREENEMFRHLQIFWEDTMGQFRDRMERELRIRGYSPKTQDCYLRSVRDFVGHFMRAPDRLSVDEINAYQLHLVEVKKLPYLLQSDRPRYPVLLPLRDALRPTPGDSPGILPGTSSPVLALRESQEPREARSRDVPNSLSDGGLERKGAGELPDARECDHLLFWYLHSAMWGRFSGSTESVLERDLHVLEDLDGSLNRLMDELRLWDGSLHVQAAHFRGWRLDASEKVRLNPSTSTIRMASASRPLKERDVE